MDILGVGFTELIFILVIAMMVFGPRRLPEIAAKAGKIVGELRGMSQGLMSEWQREITVAANLEELQKTRDELNKAKEEIIQTQQSVAKDSADVTNTIAATPKSVAEAAAAAKQTVANNQAEKATDIDDAQKNEQPPDTPALENETPPAPQTTGDASTPSTKSPVNDNGSQSEPVKETKPASGAAPHSSNNASSVLSSGAEKVVNEQ